MKTCPKCNGLYPDTAILCSNCKIRLISKSSPNNSSSQVRCPKCGSTQITAVNRKWSPMTGFLTNKTDRFCLNCKHMDLKDLKQIKHSKNNIVFNQTGILMLLLKSQFSYNEFCKII